MPYGMKGGDTPSSDKWMESCVTKVEKKKDKEGNVMGKQRAIMICKTQYEKTKGDEKKASFLIENIISLLTD